jgi:hypothetical protein
MNDTGPQLWKSKQNQEISEFKILVGTPESIGCPQNKPGNKRTKLWNGWCQNMDKIIVFLTFFSLLIFYFLLWQLQMFNFRRNQHIACTNCVNYYWYVHFKTITMKTFGVVRAENKKSTRKKMSKIRLFCPFSMEHRPDFFFQLWVARLFILFTKTPCYFIFFSDNSKCFHRNGFEMYIPIIIYKWIFCQIF